MYYIAHKGTPYKALNKRIYDNKSSAKKGKGQYLYHNPDVDKNDVVLIQVKDIKIKDEVDKQ